jgi:thioredoxin-related protein
MMISLRCCAVAALLALASALMPAVSAARAVTEVKLERPVSHQALLRESARDGSVIVALFSLQGCPYCVAIRRDQLRHLAREQAARGLRVVEYDRSDTTPFEAKIPRAAASPAALAATLGIRLAPTVVFLGSDGSELAERLVGYSSPDFYGAYLEQRIEQARGRVVAP